MDKDDELGSIATWVMSASSPPEAVLEAFSNELRHPINSIKGSIILSTETGHPLYPRAEELILQSVHRIEVLMKAIDAYVAAQKEKPD